MKVLTENHKYELSNFENPDTVQVIQFIEKVKVNNDGDSKTVNDGTTNEEVLAMLIDRLTGLNKKFPCKENKQSIKFLTRAQRLLESRTKDRVLRGVEGKHVL